MPSQNYDVIVIGGGPGGYTAAIATAQLGLNVALIEKDQVGGTCLNRGCIPTKAILESAKLFAKIKNAAKLGIKASSAELDYAAVLARKNQIVTKLTKGVEFMLKNAKVDLIRGEGKLAANAAPTSEAKPANAPPPTDYNRAVEVTLNGKTETLNCNKVILATGSEPALIQNFNIDEKDILTSTAFLNLDRLPVSVLVVGGGVMGVEFAGILALCGVKVTLIEALARILPAEDEEISQILSQMLKKLGVEIICGKQIESIIREQANLSGEQDRRVIAKLHDGSELRSEKVLITIGRRLNTKEFKSAGIKLDGEKIAVNEKMETNLPNVYAIGDITGKYLLAHVAMAQGKVAAANCAGKPETMDYSAVPWCIFSLLEIARVGLTESDAKQAGRNVKISKLPYRAIGRAKTMEAEDGFIKVIADNAAGKNAQILGAAIIGENASEIIHEAVLAIQNNLSVEQVAKTIHAHPTLSEGIMEALEGISVKR
jgi:dihydrolipoamide dehydrogenase